ncbi:hypothetical protein [Actinacidiphila oryziradicis]|jgi:hypothetical protein|uniref:hypothetical protein n=1 Tax=Actinacidiphila oryziradicis TaxID=2571141 RepID=UPI00145FB034|nr:hypothetical protein [Actinacidiphila oryziradicis]
MSKKSENLYGVDEWADRIRDASSGSDDQAVRRVVSDIYRAAQDELDEKRAQAEYEREE